MKPIFLTIVFTLMFDLASAQVLNTGAFEKLKNQYQAARKPTSVVEVLNRLASIANCAASSSADPNQLTNSMIPVKVSHKTQSFGPDFPSTILNGIAFKKLDISFGDVGSYFFSAYAETFTKDSLNIKSTYYYERYRCDVDGECGYEDETRPVVVDLRLNDKYVVYKHDTIYAYCW